MSFRRSDVELACLKWEDENGWDFFSALAFKEKTEIELDGIGLAEYVDNHRPSSDYDEDHDGEYIDVIFKIRDRHFRKSGTYSSWDADEWDGPFEEVIKAEVQRTEWVNKNKRI